MVSDPIVSLKEYIEKIIDLHNKGVDKYFESRIVDIEKRIEQARQSMEKRLDGMNEFREALKDQSAKSPTRIELNTELETLKKDIENLKISKAMLDGKASQNSFYLSLVFSVVGLILGILSYLGK